MRGVRAQLRTRDVARSRSRRLSSICKFIFLCVALWIVALSRPFLVAADSASVDGSIFIIRVEGTINPGTDDYVKSSLRRAEEAHARLFVLELSTPGGLLTSMQSIVENLLHAAIPTVVYVSPEGGSAMSAGVFITMAGHFAVMAPGTTIGAAHPVMAGGQDITGHAAEKLENFAVSLARAIAEQRGRNVKWAEDAVRESVAITDREAVAEKVVDFSASDLNRLLEQLEGKTISLRGTPVTLTGLTSAPQQRIEMNLRQQVATFLSDPNVAILLGFGALLGIGIELYHPGALLPGIFGAICLLLSLIAGQVLPINQGGFLLLLLGGAFFIAEMFVPSFGVLGIAGIVCVFLGALYFLDTEQIWSNGGFAVNKPVVGAMAGVVASFLFGVGMLAAKTLRAQVTTGQEGLVGQEGVVVSKFSEGLEENGFSVGKVRVRGEIWQARAQSEGEPLLVGERVCVEQALEGLVLLVKRTGGVKKK